MRNSLNRSERRKAAEEAVKAVGGKLEAFYFAFGKYDAYVIADIPDHASVAAASLAVNASEAVAIKTTVLLTPEELDKASKKSVSYSPPGRESMVCRAGSKRRLF